MVVYVIIFLYEVGNNANIANFVYLCKKTIATKPTVGSRYF